MTMTTGQMKAKAAAEPKSPQNPDPYMPTDAEAASAAETLSMLEARIAKGGGNGSAAIETWRFVCPSIRSKFWLCWISHTKPSGEVDRYCYSLAHDEHGGEDKLSYDLA